jgi:hypothetical protein
VLLVSRRLSATVAAEGLQSHCAEPTEDFIKYKENELEDCGSIGHVSLLLPLPRLHFAYCINKQPELGLYVF